MCAPRSAERSCKKVRAGVFLMLSVRARKVRKKPCAARKPESTSFSSTPRMETNTLAVDKSPETSTELTETNAPVTRGSLTWARARFNSSLTASLMRWVL